MTDSASHWGLALEGDDPGAILDWFAQRIWVDRVPDKLVVDYKPSTPKADWLQAMARARSTIAAHFTPDRSQSLIRYPSGVVAGRFAFEPDVEAARALLEEAPFEIASFDSLYDTWSRYRAPSFSRNHYPHGWGCAFKGAGHERLVSRRWLEYGPWRLVRGDHDLSLVQFHALGVPAKTALAQAKPAHKAMGIDDEGGFLQEPYVFERPIEGLYDKAEQTLRVVVLGREPSPGELLDARAALAQGALTRDKPLKRVAYVFPEPAAAKRSLPAIWLRGLECWTVVDGVETRLDADYAPTPAKPDWVD